MPRSRASSNADKCEIAAWETRAGRKHTYLRGQLRINEDLAGTFHFDLRHVAPGPTTSSSSSQYNSGSKPERVQVFYIADGHGEIITTQDLQIPGYSSPGQRFVTLLSAHLPAVVTTLILDHFNPTTPLYQPCASLCQALKSLQARINAALQNTAPVLCGENGSTLCLAFILRGVVYCCSVGDSSMIMVEAGNRVIPCWKRWGEDEEPDLCSFEDTLDAFPSRLREGQNKKALQKDLKALEGRLKVSREQGEYVHLVISNKSAYALRMTNTVGNFNHSGWTLSRTNVYSIPLTELPSDSFLLLVSDGVKDVMSTSQLCALTGNLCPVFTGETLDQMSPPPQLQPDELAQSEEKRSFNRSIQKWFQTESNGKSLDLRFADAGRWRIELDSRWRQIVSGPKTKQTAEVISHGLPEVIFRECRDGVAELLAEETVLWRKAVLALTHLQFQAVKQEDPTITPHAALAQAGGRLSQSAISTALTQVGLKIPRLALRQICRAVILKSLMLGSSDDLTCMAVRIPGVKGLQNDDGLEPVSSSSGGQVMMNGGVAVDGRGKLRNPIYMEQNKSRTVSSLPRLGSLDEQAEHLYDSTTDSHVDDDTTTQGSDADGGYQRRRPKTLTAVDIQRLGVRLPGLRNRGKSTTSVTSTETPSSPAGETGQENGTERRKSRRTQLAAALSSTSLFSFASSSSSNSNDTAFPAQKAPSSRNGKWGLKARTMSWVNVRKPNMVEEEDIPRRAAVTAMTAGGGVSTTALVVETGRQTATVSQGGEVKQKRGFFSRARSLSIMPASIRGLFSKS